MGRVVSGVLVPNIVFNFIEVSIIFIIGKWLDLSISNIAVIFSIFAIGRIYLGEALHYKDWYKCAIWSTVIFSSLFIVAKAGMLLGIISTVFSACVLTSRENIKNKKASIQDIFMWKKKGIDSKYSEITAFVSKNKDKEVLLKFENILKELDENLYSIYELKFYQNKKNEEIVVEMNIKDIRRIYEKLDLILFSYQTYIRAINKEKSLTY